MNEPLRPARPGIVYGTLLAVQLAFASHHVVSKVVVDELPPAALALVRAGSATVVMFLIHLAVRGLPRVAHRDLPKLAGCGLLGIAGNQLLYFYGLERTTSVNASVLITTIPVFTVVVSVLLKKERFVLRRAVGVGVAMSGVLLLVGWNALSLGLTTAVGDVMVVLNSLLYAGFLVLVGPLVAKYGSLTVVVWLFAFGALFVAPLGVPELVGAAPSVPMHIWGLAGYVVLVPTIFTYLANTWALGYARPSLVAIFIYLQPVGATLLAVIFLDATVELKLLLAASLVFTGIYLVARTPTAQQTP